MKVTLAYGKSALRVNIPDEHKMDVIVPRYVKGVPDEQDAVSKALADPICHKALKDAVNPDQKVAIVFSDITRATPYHVLVPPLLKSLKQVPDRNITFFCATGTHRVATRKELNTILGKEIVERFRIVQNDAAKREQFQYVGTTKAGNRILLNKEILEYDLRILTGFIEPHFFAGFSGGGKALMPGMAHLDSIRYNHSIRMLENPMARWGNTHGNPLWEDVMEAAEFAAPLFLLNITLNRNKEITGVFAGELREAHKRGCMFVKETAMVPLDQPYDIVVTSNSGYPLDLNIYQSVKGMSAAEQVVKKGGTIVIAAECWDGIPSGSDFEKILISAGSVPALMDFVRKNEAVYQDTWQVYFQAMIQEKTTVYLYSTLDDTTVERALLKPAGNLDQLLLKLIQHHGKESRICVLPEGPLTIPYLSS
ncbi:MAG: nickel-dependent lactate racemase [Bacteroidota bacterium]